jgi:hypothetical protein
VRQDLDTGDLDDDDEWRLSSGTLRIRVGLEEVFLVTADAHADEQDSEDV